MFSKQWTTVHSSIRPNISYVVYIRYGGNSASLTCSMEANNLYVCLFESTSQQRYIFPKNSLTPAREAQLCNQLYSGYETQTGYALDRSEGFQI